MHSDANIDSAMWRGRHCPRNASTKMTPAGNPSIPLAIVVLALLTALTPWLAAQKAPAPAHSAIPQVNRPTANFAFNQSRHPYGFRRSTPRTSLPFPFFGDSFNLDDLYSSGYPVASQPPVFLLQAASALAGPADFPGYSAAFPPANSREPSPSQPLMIELQNGNYVRVNRAPVNGEALPLAFAPNQIHPQSAPQKIVISRKKVAIPSETRDLGFASTTVPPPRELPPVLLVFHDGHNEEVRDYTIADGALYARGDYYTDGFWNKKIELSALNLTKTLQVNADRSVNFVLPKSPNEVITRP
jgi:hypothetical protein